MICLRYASFVAALAFAITVPAVSPADEPPAWFHVSVAGQVLAPADVGRLTVEMLRIYSRARYLQKDAADMPAASPLVWYGGKGSGKPEIWILRSLQRQAAMSPREEAELSRQQSQAQILAVLDAGDGGAALERAYAKTPPDAQDRIALASEIVQAMQDASAQTAAQSVVDRRWVLAHVPAGTPRVAALQAIASRQLAVRTSSDGTVVVSFPGQFEPGCSFSTELTLTFDVGDLLEKIDASEPIANCL